ncbi:hypothetical protein CFIMG_007999RA00001 [Ceratocystis fimbriata CBS 114723]|uniref:Uncharacterized protein n=1 Tax=Ceratocystis fimbriata CBS 114723 TaxID=1035309 RepID=A0A2C5XLF5_9PEZI|nr:hypothetical protein CFIMG_007999RA00001 [Ceratocystis fimbriata CBS 114723]
MEDNSQILSLPNSTATIEVPAQNGEPASQTDAVPTSAAATTTTNATTAPAVPHLQCIIFLAYLRWLRLKYNKARSHRKSGKFIR